MRILTSGELLNGRFNASIELVLSKALPIEHSASVGTCELVFRVGLNSLWAVEHPDLNRAFDASLTGIDSDARESSFVASVEATELPPRMPIRRVAQHGFVGVERQQYFQDTFTYLFKVRSFRIHLGNRKLPAPRDLIRRSGVDFFEVVLCKVRLGQTEVSQSSQLVVV